MRSCSTSATACSGSAFRRAIGLERFLFELLDASDEFSVVVFNHEPRALTQWTQAPDVVRTAMAALKPFGSTALYDAVLTTLPMMDTAPNSARRC